MSYEKWDWKQVPEEAGEMFTTRQRQYFLAFKSGKKWEDIAEEFDTSHSAVVNMAAKLKTKLRSKGLSPSGYEPLTYDPHYVKGISDYQKRNEETGEMETVARWVKTDTEKEEKAELFKEFIEGLKEEVPRIKKTNVKPKDYPKDIMPTVVIGDAHIGAYAYAPATRGRDFDTDSASEEIRLAIDDLVSRSPNADVGMLVNVGDFLHSDTSRGETWSGTRLDNDTRRKRVLNVAAQTFRYCIDRMLKKFNKVVVVNARGNHDDNSSLAISVILETAYEKEPRVEVLETEGYFHYIEYGKWLIGVHHGDKLKGQRLGGQMAKLLPEAWGRTTHRLWMLGHYHHKKAEELEGVTLRTFGTLAPPDDWHASMGFGSESSMEMVVFRKEGGIHSELVYSIPKTRQEPDIKL